MVQNDTTWVKENICPNNDLDLIQLDISRNHIADLRGELMTLTCLQELDISRNRLQTMDECLPPAPRLKCVLMCSCVTSSRKRQIPKELLHLSAIQHLDLRFNALRALPADDYRRSAWLNVDRFSTTWVSCWPSSDCALSNAEFGEVTCRYFGLP